MRLRKELIDAGLDHGADDDPVAPGAGGSGRGAVGRGGASDPGAPWSGRPAAEETSEVVVAAFRSSGTERVLADRRDGLGDRHGGGAGVQHRRRPFPGRDRSRAVLEATGVEAWATFMPGGWGVGSSGRGVVGQRVVLLGQAPRLRGAVRTNAARRRDPTDHRAALSPPDHRQGRAVPTDPQEVATSTSPSQPTSPSSKPSSTTFCPHLQPPAAPPGHRPRVTPISRWLTSDSTRRRPAVRPGASRMARRLHDRTGQRNGVVELTRFKIHIGRRMPATTRHRRPIDRQPSQRLRRRPTRPPPRTRPRPAATNPPVDAEEARADPSTVLTCHPCPATYVSPMSRDRTDAIESRLPPRTGARRFRRFRCDDVVVGSPRRGVTPVSAGRCALIPICPPRSGRTNLAPAGRSNVT